MKTLDMMIEAQKSNKTYSLGVDYIREDGVNVSHMRYSLQFGFHDKNGNPWHGVYNYMNDFFDIDSWTVLNE